LHGRDVKQRKRLDLNHWIALTIAIIAEVVGTTALKASNEFTRLWPSLLVVFGYGAAFYFMAISMRMLPVGIIYAIWSGMGIVLVSIIGWLVFEQTLDFSSLIGMGLIISGVLVINLFSSSVGH
jgi:small multidrug resistance pump